MYDPCNPYSDADALRKAYEQANAGLASTREEIAEQFRAILELFGKDN